MATKLPPAGADDVIYLVDLSSHIYRAYHAIAPLTSPTGEPTHAVFGAVNMLERMIKDQQPALLAVAMDAGGTTFRKERYPEYKANRPPQPDDLRSQIGRVEEIIGAFNVPVLKEPGVEADDLIASTVKAARAQKLRVVIVSADKDLMQLVGDDVMLWDTMRDRVIGIPEVEKRFGVRVDQVRDVLALMGDTSDNVPGVPSVGPKTAKDLLTEHDTLDGVYEHLETIKRKKLKENLTTYRDQAFLSRELVTLKEDCEVGLDPAIWRRSSRDVATLQRIYGELGFHRLISQLDATEEGDHGSTREPEVSFVLGRLECVHSTKDLDAVVTELEEAGTFALDVVPCHPEKHGWDIAGLAVCASADVAYYLPCGHRLLGGPPQLSLDVLRERLGPLLDNPLVEKVGHNTKRTQVLLERAGFTLGGVTFDHLLASYLVDPEARHGLDDLAKAELGVVLTSYEETVKPGKAKRVTFDQVPLDRATEYAAARAQAALALVEPVRNRLASLGLVELHDEVELPLARLLARIEQHGVALDTAVLATLGQEAETTLAQLEKKAHTVAGKEFNVNSPRQLETILFDDLGLKPLKRTKTSRSTDAATLEALAEEHELPELILEIRQLAKLKGTYIDTLPQLVRPSTGRLHTSWEQAVAATGRLSSTDPNLQNIPIRTELGRKIRAAFTPRPGHRIVSADYSQIELRVLAHLSEDPLLLEAFRTGQDVHTRTAAEIFEVPPDEVTKEQRRRAKAVNFGVIYGQGDSGLAKGLGISRAEASNFIAAYFRRYEGVRTFMDDTLVKARAGEAVRSVLGRRRLLPDIRSANRARRLAAERIAMNMPIQGTAADILKLAMLALAEPVTKGSTMILTVHDELVFDVPEAEVETASAAIKDRMEGAYELAVPLVVEVGSGPDWNAAH